MIPANAIASTDLEVNVAGRPCRSWAPASFEICERRCLPFILYIISSTTSLRWASSERQRAGARALWSRSSLLSAGT